MRHAPNATTQAAILKARRVRARYDTAKDLNNAIQGKRTKKKRTRKVIAQP